jgi:hypothetical protein
MLTLARHGLTLRVPRGWEARMWVPDLPPPAINLPVVRLANFPLALTRDTYAEDSAHELRPAQVVASLVEFEPALADVGLYAPQGFPALDVEDMSPKAVQLRRADRLGLQRFFSVDGRAFSLYVIARRGTGLRRALNELETVLAETVVDPPEPA